VALQYRWTAATVDERLISYAHCESVDSICNPRGGEKLARDLDDEVDDDAPVAISVHALIGCAELWTSAWEIAFRACLKAYIAVSDAVMIWTGIACSYGLCLLLSDARDTIQSTCSLHVVHSVAAVDAAVCAQVLDIAS